MRIAVTGATGFLGRYIVQRLAASGHALRCWRRAESDASGFNNAPGAIEWVHGGLGEPDGFTDYCRGVDAIVHGALARAAGTGFRAAADAGFENFIRLNLHGSLMLMRAARAAGVSRFVFISTCAVHEVILPDRPLDEAHPLWATSHYGAHKAAIEKFVHSFGLGEGWPICAVRPTGIYGVAHPPARSKWYELVRRVTRGEPMTCERGGKEVHAADVAKAVEILLTAPEESIRGQAFNCYDRYVADYTVAKLAAELSGSGATITGNAASPKNQIAVYKIMKLGMTFGGEALLRETVDQLVNHARADSHA